MAPLSPRKTPMSDIDVIPEEAEDADDGGMCSITSKKTQFLFYLSPNHHTDYIETLKADSPRMSKSPRVRNEGLCRF